MIISTDSLACKKWLIPNFICSIVLNILDEFNISYTFYQVNKDLNYSLSQAHQVCDVLYIINYFGVRRINLNIEKCKNKYIIEDNVFSIFTPKSILGVNWCTFNSLRKITHLADGSIINSNFPLNENKRKYDEAPFVKQKYIAKYIKYDYLNFGKYVERDYLDKFAKSEEMLNEQLQIYGMSQQSLSEYLVIVTNYKAEIKHRKLYFEIVNNYLSDYAIKIKTDFYSFAPILIPYRNKIRKALFKHKVFLPVHWPNDSRIENDLSDNILSIPLSTTYKQEDIVNVCKLIVDALKKLEL
ncbi:hypothetical protein TI05_08060 [Achromatium sp. WMS3]|nr:hypothetical protein TI05_08060 [Achromatium sp. WMS3]